MISNSPSTSVQGLILSILKAYAYLVRPGKGVDAPPSISSKDITIGSDSLSDMLTDVFNGQASSHDFEITFNAASDGAQVNPCRDLLVAFQNNATNANGLPIAQRLQKVTDNRSGIGLLFVLTGTSGLKHRLVVSRFPTDKAVLAEIGEGGLAVEFLEQVFIKRLSSYKALMLEHATPANGFWKGIATDRQAGRSGEHISEYWLKEFLEADFSETPAAGTRRLAKALKDAVKVNPNLDVKAEIAHASTLAPAAFLGQNITIEQFCNHFGFSQSARETIRSQLAKPSLYGKMFQFDAAEFKTTAPYRTIEMSNGAILTAPNDEFETVFSENIVSDNEVEYTTRGKISDQRLTAR